MSSYSFSHTVSCNKPEPIFVDGRWFKVVGIQKHQGLPVVDALVQKDGAWMCSSVFLRTQVRTEILPNVFATVIEAGKPSKIRLRIEIAEGVPVTFGSNVKKQMERKQRVFIPLAEVPFFANQAFTRAPQ